MFHKSFNVEALCYISYSINVCRNLTSITTIIRPIAPEPFNFILYTCVQKVLIIFVNLHLIDKVRFYYLPTKTLPYITYLNAIYDEWILCFRFYIYKNYGSF